ncbi:DUF6093 family protein [Cryobacterium sp. TMS1-13-1]|uniref:DUF6093 family protein n=1 Tax=Cryobacterium sp. TMS1-13-1 TaxID=1259220 RepID=UPI00106ABF97|nr:DUF6093 family protein [Cryobacterium sp. TMS1-13-1]TFD22137.1 hypothetical protein E3T31_08630 [Cryobacterium sp. TMS1-13-1]
MNIEQHVLAGRREAEKLMTTRCTVTRGGGEPVFNESTGQYETAVVTVYSGPGRIRRPSLAARTATPAGQTITVQDLVLSLPVVTSAAVKINDVVTVTANPLDPALIGVVFTITGLHDESTATARRFPIERTS